MMYLSAIIIFCVVVLSIAKFVKMRSFIKPEELLLKLTPVTLDILPFCSDRLEYYEEVEERDRKLWKALRGARGLIAIARNASLILSASRAIAKESENWNEYQYIFRLASQLLCLSISSIPEIALNLLGIHYPRICAREIASIYFVMTLSVRQQFEAYRPHLIPDLAQVL